MSSIPDDQYAVLTKPQRKQNSVLSHRILVQLLICTLFLSETNTRVKDTNSGKNIVIKV